MTNDDHRNWGPFSWTTILCGQMFKYLELSVLVGDVESQKPIDEGNADKIATLGIQTTNPIHDLHIGWNSVTETSVTPNPTQKACSILDKGPAHHFWVPHDRLETQKP